MLTPERRPSRATLVVLTLLSVGLMWSGHLARLEAQAKVRLNPLIGKLEKGELALTGRDWLFIDMEHGPYLLDRLQATLADIGKRKTPKGPFDIAPIVRIPMEGDENVRFATKQVLDMGALGVVFPHVDTAEQATAAIRAMRYPPQRGSRYPNPAGVRGWGPGRAATYWGVTVPEYAFTYADVWPLNPDGDLFAMVMIETPLGVKNADAIARVPGVGALFIGASDLGVSMGVGPPGAGGVLHPETEAAIHTVLRACAAAKVACAFPVLGGEVELKKRTAEGFKVLMLAGGSATPSRP